MKNAYKFRVATLVMVALTSSWADELTTDTLAQMSFEDLMNVDVGVVSRKDESIIDAPGMVTTFSNADMQRYGYYTLGELADLTPGFSSTYLFGERGFETRGLKSDAFNNNRHLVMVNGIPVNHVRANKAPTQEELPTLFAERVEFLRGPASALYGNSAYYGVVNVIPEIPKDEGTLFRSRISFGNEQQNRQVMASLASRTDKAIFSTSASFYEKQASETPFGVPGSDNRLYYDDRQALFGMGNYELASGPLQGLGAGMIYMSRQTGLGEHWGTMSHELNDLKWSTMVAYLKYQRSFTDQISTNTYFKYNKSNEEGTFITINDSIYNNIGESLPILTSSYEVPVENYELYANMEWLNRVVDVTAGVNFDWRFTSGAEGGGHSYYLTLAPEDRNKEGYPYVPEPLAFTHSDTYRTSSVFLQLKREFPVLAGIIMTAGVRGDFGEASTISYQTFSPRISVVQKFTDQMSLKFNYGTALAAPGLKEEMLNTETLDRNPSLESQLSDLEPETFKTLELGMVFHPTISGPRNRYFLSAEIGGFYNSTRNSLKAVNFTAEQGTVNAFVNSSDTVSSSGIEIALKSRSEYGLGAFTNYSYAIGYNQDRQEVVDVPLHRIQGGIDWLWEKTGIFGALLGRSISGYTTGDKNHRICHSNFMDMRLGWKSPVGLSIEAQVKNLLDGTYYYPSDGKEGIEFPARSVTFTLNGEF